MSPRPGRFSGAFILALLVWSRPAAAQTEVGASRSAGQDPGQTSVSSQEIEDLRRQIFQETRSSLEWQFDAHGETGDLNNKVDFLRFGMRLNLRYGPATTVVIAAHRTPYRTDDPAYGSTATGVTLGLRRKASERFEWQGELTGAHFEGGTWSITGYASLSVRATDALRCSVTVQRTNVDESLLAIAGLRPVEGPFAGERVGGVHDNRLKVNGAYRLPARFDVFGEVGAGSRSGSQVDGNLLKGAGGGLGWNAVARPETAALSLLRVSTAFDYFGYDVDRLGYGGASLLDAQGQPIPPERLGSDGISPVPTPTNPGVGGYFSPDRFTSAIVRVDARGRAGTAVEYSASGFLGKQSFTGTAGHRASGLSAGVTFHLSRRLTLPVAYTWDDFGPFVQQSFVTRLVFLF